MKHTRKELETYTVAWNTCLKESVSKMDNVTLLRNAHPAYRDTYARSLFDDGLLTEDEVGEFVRLKR